jgi:hypothetical protein
MKAKLKTAIQSPFEYQKYSRIGIASFILALITGLLVIADISLVLRFQNDPQAVQFFRSMDLWLTWLMLALAVSGIVLGLAALTQKQKKRLFGIVGLSFNGFFLLAIIGLYVANLVAFWSLAR